MAQAIAMDVLAFYMDFLAGSKHQKQDFCDLEVRDTVRAPRTDGLAVRIGKPAAPPRTRSSRR
jgi:hypothetical protein